MKLSKVKGLLIFFVVVGAIVATFYVVSSRRFQELNDRYVQLSEGFEESIVFINVGEKDRGWIAQKLLAVDSLSPQIVGVDLFFKNYDSTDVDDEMLLSAIKRTKPILATKHHGQGTYAVDEVFLEAAGGYGFADLIIDDKYATQVPVYYKSASEVVYSFPYEMVRNINDSQAEKYASMIDNNIQDLVITKLGDQFKVISEEEVLTEEFIKGKIVIFGYLGPSDEDKKTTYARYHMKGIDRSTGKPDTYGPVLHANQILKILNSSC